jgi:hypothetical protein
MRTEKMKASNKKLDIKGMAILAVRTLVNASDTMSGQWRQLSSIDQAIEWLDCASSEYDVMVNERYLTAGKAKGMQGERAKIDADLLTSRKPAWRKNTLLLMNTTPGLAFIPQGHTVGYLAKQGFMLKETAPSRKIDSDKPKADESAKAATVNNEKFAEMAKRQSATQSELEIYKAWVALYIEQAKAAHLALIEKPAPKTNVVKIVRSNTKAGKTAVLAKAVNS